MNLHLTGHHSTSRRRSATTSPRKLERITRHFDHVIDVNVIMSVDKLQQKVEANVHVRGKDILCESADERHVRGDRRPRRQARPPGDQAQGEEPRSAPQRHDQASVGTNSRALEMTDPHGPQSLAMNLIAKLLPLTERPPRPRRVEQEARCSSRSGLLFENNASIAPQRRLRQPVRAREARLDRAGPGHRDPARPHQGPEGSARRLRAPRAADPVRCARRQPVSLVFVLLVPEQRHRQHLQILSELAQMFSDQPLREQLLARAPTRGRAAPACITAMATACRKSASARLFEDNREKLKLAWVAGREGGIEVLTASVIKARPQG